MNTVLFVNHSQENCGVHSYGKRVAQIFKGSRKWNVVYAEPGSPSVLAMLVMALKPAFVIYNYLAQTMAWLDHPTIRLLRNEGVKQGLIVHNIGQAEIFDFYLHQNPGHPQDATNFPLFRPLFDYKKKWGSPDTPDAYKVPEKQPPLCIGTFGFALPEKNYPEICRLVNDQFDEAEIRMHLTAAHFRPDQGWLEQIKADCDKAITKPGMRLYITTDFRDDEAILDFLDGNDLNVFLYQHFPHYNGISSVIDYALSVRQPIAVCKSGLFSHINNAVPSICVEDRPLPEIMQGGFEPVRKFAKEWSNPNFVSHLEGILDSIG
jgi:hypothetical protein